MIKKIIYTILVILLVLSISLFGYIFTRDLKTKYDNTNIKKQITSIKDSNDNIVKENEGYTKELEKLKEEIKEQISEYEVWKETKEKIKTIIG